MKKLSSGISLVAKNHRTTTSRWQGAPCFRRYGRELVSKPAISLKKSWGGYRRTTHRTDEAVDINALGDGDDSIGWIIGGEYLRYTVRVSADGTTRTINISVFIYSPNGGVVVIFAHKTNCHAYPHSSALV